MMKKFITIGAVLVLSLSMLAGCGNSDKNDAVISEQSSDVAKNEVVEEIPETKNEEAHIHNYVEEITTEATCEADGLKTLTCECGDSYTEAIPATGHNFENYVSNEDATYSADGTETGTCICGLTDTRTAEGSKLEFTFTDCDAVMYAKSSVNVRDLPSTDGERIGGLSARQEVHVTGQCNETGWYRIAYGDGEAYVSNSYIVAERPAEPQPQPEQPTQPSGNYDGYDEFGNGYVWGADGYKHFDASCPYPINQIVDNHNQVYYYGIYGQPQKAEECKDILSARFGVIINNNHKEHYKVGYYKEGLVTYNSWTYNP